MIESRGKYGLTNATYTCKTGGFLPFGMVHTNVLNSCVAAAGDAGAAGPVLPGSRSCWKLQTPGTTNQHNVGWLSSNYTGRAGELLGDI